MSTIDSPGQSAPPGAQFDTAFALFEQGEIEAAYQSFRIAYESDRNSARIRSYYGLCLGMTERAFETALELCQSAAKQEFFNPELYLNLARLHLGFGFRAQGVRYLRRGLMIDPGNRELSALLQTVGDRRDPVIRFLPRRHPINRWLGAARYAFVRRAPVRWAA